jgi:DNA-directed RNA polymerase subunit RPC12/RpoP
MSTINLQDVKVSYEGQTLPVTTLISKLQAQLQEATCRIAAIASTLGDLQAALLNSNTVDVKLTLTREDYDRFRSLAGADDAERIRRAVMVMIRPEEAANPSTPAEAVPVAAPVELQPVEAKAAAEPAAAPAASSRPTTTCPRCHSLIDLPETSNDQWSVEIKCASCGTKYLVKSRADASARG